MNLQLYTESQFEYNDIAFIVRAFRNVDNLGFVIRAFFADGSKANYLSYTVDYETQLAMRDSTEDNAVGLLMQQAKEAIMSGQYFYR
jgi:hypothetical protein